MQVAPSHHQKIKTHPLLTKFLANLFIRKLKTNLISYSIQWTCRHEATSKFLAMSAGRSHIPNAKSVANGGAHIECIPKEMKTARPLTQGPKLAQQLCQHRASKLTHDNKYYQIASVCIQVHLAPPICMQKVTSLSGQSVWYHLHVYFCYHFWADCPADPQTE